MKKKIISVSSNEIIYCSVWEFNTSSHEFITLRKIQLERSNLMLRTVLKYLFLNLVVVKTNQRSKGIVCLIKIIAHKHIYTQTNRGVLLSLRIKFNFRLESGKLKNKKKKKLSRFRKESKVRVTFTTRSVKFLAADD